MASIERRVRKELVDENLKSGEVATELIIGKLSAILVLSSLLLGCGNIALFGDTSCSKSGGRCNQSEEQEKTVNEASRSRDMQGKLCYDIKYMDAEPIVDDGSIVGHYIRSSFQTPDNMCTEREWSPGRLDQIRGGEFVFPIGLLDDLEVRTDVLSGYTNKSLRSYVGLLVLELYGVYRERGLSNKQKVEMSIRFCKKASGSSCGSGSWQQEFTHVELLRRSSAEAGTDDLLVVKFSNALDQNE